MRLLDPNLLTSETGKILVRDNAIVFSVEHVRLIITADCVIIPQTGFEQSSLSTRFAVMLEEAIIEASQEKEVSIYCCIVCPSHLHRAARSPHLGLECGLQGKLLISTWCKSKHFYHDGGHGRVL